MNGIRCQTDGLFSNRALVRLIFPLVMEQALAALVGMCDGVMVSAVGEAAISGVSLVDMINNVILNLFAALATGGAVITSQFLGARRQEEARKSAGSWCSCPPCSVWASWLPVWSWRVVCSGSSSGRLPPM